jgi:hypothetical protein
VSSGPERATDPLDLLVPLGHGLLQFGDLLAQPVPLAPQRRQLRR